MKAKKPRTKWVDFKTLKERVGIEDILRHYDLLDEMTERKNHELVGFCPIHDENRYNKNAFSVNTEKNAWICFACGQSGNVLDFVFQMEDVDIREAGLLIQEWFGLTSEAKQLTKKEKRKPKPEKTNTRSEKPAAKPEKSAAKAKARDPDKEPVNPPLTFELKNLDQEHPYLKERGLKEETIKEFGIGSCSRGLMKDRIAIPIHNENGELVAYAGSRRVNVS